MHNKSSGDANFLVVMSKVCYQQSNVHRNTVVGTSGKNVVIGLLLSELFMNEVYCSLLLLLFVCLAIMQKVCKVYAHFSSVLKCR